MGNIVSYIQKDQRTFAESPFNSVDSLVFSTLSYFNFECCGFVDPASPEQVRLHDVVALSAWEKLICTSWLEDARDTQDFLHAVMASRRFRDVGISFYAHERSGVVEKQFSAVTFSLDGKENSVLPACIAFRGTDGSFAGWKEDFNLCFKSVIPSQRAAAAYLSGVASATRGSLILTGHSKGGNLAEFAALVVDEGIFDRFENIYNHDGPSFLDDPSPRISEAKFINILKKTVPESSAFGMILERRIDYRVVQSSAISVFQHEPFSWFIDQDDFVYQDALNPSALFFDDTLDTWLRSKTSDDRERFIDTIYELFAATEATTWAEFQTKLLANTRQMLGQGSRLDPETRSFILQTLGGLAAILKDKTMQRFRPLDWLPGRKERYAQETCLVKESQSTTVK